MRTCVSFVALSHKKKTRPQAHVPGGGSRPVVLSAAAAPAA